jgi:hypothetical protein
LHGGDWLATTAKLSAKFIKPRGLAQGGAGIGVCKAARAKNPWRSTRGDPAQKLSNESFRFKTDQYHYRTQHNYTNNLSFEAPYQQQSFSNFE